MELHFDSTHGLIRRSQHGFCKNRTCTTNVLEFMKDVGSLLDRQMLVDVIFLDFQEAFDKVPHQHFCF